MVIVTGTMRSGTSMWMQILGAAGFPPIGEAFPAPWGERLRSANPKGFYESQFVAGIYYATNPQPESGVYLFPEQTRTHAVKVFVPGLLRTDLAFVHRVVATVRDWRQYSGSVNRMRRLDGQDREAVLFDLPISPALRWWVENYTLIRDIATRRYAVHVTTYDRILADPGAEIAAVMTWIGSGDVEAATAVVEPRLRTEFGEIPVPEDLDDRHVAVFDELFDALHRGEDLSPAFVDELNRTDESLRPRIEQARGEARDKIMNQLAPARA